MLLLPLASASAGTAQCPDILVSEIPPRPSGAPDAAKFVQEILRLSAVERESRLATELQSANIPDRLRHLEPVTLRAENAGDAPTEITICVARDYLAIGSDDDFLRVPMGLQAAMATAASFGFVLPTPKMVDAIYEQAGIRLTPEPMPAGDEMRSTAYFVAHDHRIEAQRDDVGGPPDGLIAGHKKDLVLTNRLWSKPGRVAIYGWHRPDGTAIQPLSTVHGARYADYSHGVRLVSLVAYVDGQPRSLLELLEDPRTADVLTGEGPIEHVAELVHVLAGSEVSSRSLERDALRLAEAASRAAAVAMTGAQRPSSTTLR
jgi:hypothetical protein